MMASSVYRQPLAGSPRAQKDGDVISSLALRMGVTPSLFALHVASRATSSSHLHTDAGLIVGDVHGGAVVHRLGDIRGRAYLEQPSHTDRSLVGRCTWEALAHVLVISAAAPTSNSHLHTDSWPSCRRCTWDSGVVRLGDVRGRPHLEQPLATDSRPSSRRSTWECRRVRLADVRGRAHLEQPLHADSGLLAGEMYIGEMPRSPW